MKKIFGISLIAVFAVTPLMANADIVAGDPGATVTDAAVAGASPKYGLAAAEAGDDNAASAGYVKGAYNATIKAINRLAQDTTTALAGKQATIADLETIKAGAAAGATALQNNSELDGANLKSGSVAASALSPTVQAALANADNALQEADMADYAKKAGTVATINKATASGSVSSTVEGTASGDTSGTVKIMRQWGSTDAEDLTITTSFSGATVSGSATGSFTGATVNVGGYYPNAAAEMPE